MLCGHCRRKKREGKCIIADGYETAGSCSHHGKRWKGALKLVDLADDVGKTCSPLERLFRLPEQLHSQITLRTDLSVPEQQTLVSAPSGDDPLCDKAVDILSKSFPSRDRATINSFVVQAIKSLQGKDGFGTHLNSAKNGISITCRS